MASVKKKECACKGIRTCLKCENAHEGNRVHESKADVAVQELFYCQECQRCYPGQATDRCEEHAQCTDAGTPLQGISILPEFVSEEEEAELIATIEQTPWRESQSGRRKQDYGPKVNFKKKKLQCSPFTGLPSFSRYLVERMRGCAPLADFIPVELCNLEYDPERGAAIDPHFDDFWLWGERLVTLNLLADTYYTMTRPPGEKVEEKEGKEDKEGVECRVLLRRRDLIVLEGDARHVFMHSIQRSDITTKRLGITLRELSKEFLSGGPREEVGNKVIETALGFQGRAVGVSEKFNGNREKLKGDGGKLKGDGEKLKGDEEKLKGYGEKLHGDGEKLIGDGEKLNGDREKLNRDGDKLNEDGEKDNGEGESIEDKSTHNGNQDLKSDNSNQQPTLTHEEKMAKGGFQKVKKKKSAKPSKSSNTSNVNFSKMVSGTLSETSCTVDEILHRIQAATEELCRDGYVDRFWNTMIRSMESKQGLCRNGNTDQSCETPKFPDSCPIERIVSYGIGSFATCYKARYQLALLALVARKIEGRECVVYDPVWSEVERQCLMQLGFNVSTENERGCRLVEAPTLFYLPHCPRHLTNNLLWSNWTPVTLTNLCIVASNLKDTPDLPAYITQEDSIYIFKVLPYTSSTDIPNTFSCADDIFNNLAVNTFPADALSQAPKALWEVSEPPVYTDPDAQELNVIAPVKD